MAVDATTIWEFRATGGSATNGGGFADLDPGTSVDYSNQDASQLSLTDCATSGIGVTTLTSATGGFTAAMAGSVMYLHTGTNLTDGWYQITVFTDTNTVTLDRAPDDGVGGVSAGDCEVGGALDILTDAFIDNANTMVAGVKIWIKNDGTMTLTGGIETILDGTGALPITIEGYNTTRGDDPTGTNRPLIAAAANTFKFGDYWTFKHLRVTTTELSGFYGFLACNWFNCASNNSSGSSNRNALYSDSAGSNFIGCDAQSANGYAINAGNGGILTHGCYMHDSSTGWIADTTGNTISLCVIDTCTSRGIDINSRDRIKVINNTIYNCGTGIYGTTAGKCAFLNNIIDANTTGASWTSEIKNNWWDYNCWDNTTDTSNVTKGDNSVTGDPAMTDPANGDFSIPAGSNCADAALDAGDLTGATV